MAKQQIPNPSSYKTIFAANYKPNLKFYELLMPAALKFDEYPHWQTDKLSVTLWDNDKKCNLRLGHNSYSFAEDSKENKYQIEYIEKALTILPSALEISAYNRLGFRRKYLTPIKMKYEELVTLFFVKNFSHDKLDKILPGKVFDLSFLIDLSDEKLKFHINIGPINKDQTPRFMEFDKAHHLDPKTREKDYIELVDRYPQVAIFQDIDIFRDEQNIPTTEGIPFLKEADSRMNKFVNDFREFLFVQEGI